MPLLPLRRPENFLDSIGLSALAGHHGSPDSSAFAVHRSAQILVAGLTPVTAFSNSVSGKFFPEQLYFSIDLAVSSLLILTILKKSLESF